LAALPDDRLAYRFIQDALERPGTTRQLVTRADPVLQAAVGLNSKKRASIERLLLERMQAADIDDAQRADLVFVIAILGDLSPQAARVMIPMCLDGLEKTTDPVALGGLTFGLEAAYARLPAEESAARSRDAAAKLLPLMARTNDPSVLSYLAGAMKTV